jgi:hypothetical protein
VVKIPSKNIFDYACFLLTEQTQIREEMSYKTEELKSCDSQGTAYLILECRLYSLIRITKWYVKRLKKKARCGVIKKLFSKMNKKCTNY